MSSKIRLLLLHAAAGRAQGPRGSHWQSHLCVAEPNEAACHADDLQWHLRPPEPGRMPLSQGCDAPETDLC